MSFKCALIGLPNVGKSTLFNSLTNSSVSSDNFPFCTINPNVGIVSYHDKRLYNIAKIVCPQKVSPSSIEFVDVAGLVKGAHKGEGLGNKFLNNIRETDALIHVVRCFTDKKILHVSGKIDPISDIETVNLELIFSDIERCKKFLSKRHVHSSNKFSNSLETNVLTKCLLHLEKFNMLKNFIFTNEENNILKQFNFLTIKPLMYVVNMNEHDFLKENSLFNQILLIAKKNNISVIPLCFTLEFDISKMKLLKERREFIKDLNIKEQGLNKVIREGYKMLNLFTYFTMGKKEVKAWTITKGMTAPEAASKIHSDLKKGFIRAKVISYLDFISYKSEIKLKKLGKVYTQGKNYIVQDGDIINFLFNI
ncbi:redox-regulated ATPase YchF [Buchnera aphidicola (Neophyllaphis varicolor)]|uniref:redox-regulated ATPase YchF n=1 Tax=Buchnera aphidicola TaxID=9 RepID=UPI0031B8219D